MKLSCLCALLLSHSYILGALCIGFFKGSKSSREEQQRTLLPKLLPHPDTSYLIEFVSDSSDHCAQMEPVIKRLEKDLQTRVRRINISKRSDFMSLFECVGGTECGTVPFFYNRRTAQAICGATPYSNLKKLAMGDPTHLFYDAPQNIFEKSEYDPRKQRGVGFTEFLAEKMMRLNKKRFTNKQQSKSNSKQA